MTLENIRIIDLSPDVCSSDLSNQRVFSADSERKHHQAARLRECRDLGRVHEPARLPEQLPVRRLRQFRQHERVLRGQWLRDQRSPRYRATALRQHLRSEEHTSELQSLMRISYAVFCLKKKTTNKNNY